MNRKLIWKYVLTGIISACLMAALTACSSKADNKKEQVIDNTPTVEETVEPTEEVQQPDAEVEIEPTKEVVEEPVEETTLEEPQNEMVDFETWAKQEGNDEVCLVVWNEELGIQEILPTYFESKEIYEIQEGDRFAVPYRSNIAYVSVNGDSDYKFDGSNYLELLLERDQTIQLNLGYDDENGELVVLFYAFQ